MNSSKALVARSPRDENRIARIALRRLDSSGQRDRGRGVHLRSRASRSSILVGDIPRGVEIVAANDRSAIQTVVANPVRVGVPAAGFMASFAGAM
jgi:hypothetical protein